MRYGVIFCVLGLCWLALAILHGGFAWVLLWPALAFAVTGFAYLGLGARAFGKRPDGSIPPLHFILLFPYVGLAWLTWALLVVLRNENACDEVGPDLWVGRRPGRRDLPPRVNLIVDLTCELWEPVTVRRACRYISVPTLDASAPSAEAVRAILDELVPHAGVILIHCAQGHGRSAAVAAAVLVARGIATDTDDAIRRITTARPGVRVNTIQTNAVARVNGFRH